MQNVHVDYILLTNKRTELNKEMLGNISGGWAAGIGTIVSLTAQLGKTLNCNKENSWGRKMNAKCSCGLHFTY